MAKTTKEISAKPFTEEYLKVKDLEIDPRIQRFKLDLGKIERIKRNFNPVGLGVITVSRRNSVTQIMLDGWHRHQVVKELTDNEGELYCHVYERLTIAEEAQMFLDLNAGNQPSLLEKFMVRIVAGDEVAIAIDALVKSYQWTISPTTANGNIQCVGALERIYRRSVLAEAEPNYLQVALLAVSRAWGQERHAAQAVILEGVAALVGEHGEKLNLERLITKMESYPSGPLGLNTDAVQVAKIRRGRVPMAVAEQLTDEYNKGLTSNALPPWRKRRP
jgi:hypothetical protein